PVARMRWLRWTIAAATLLAVSTTAWLVLRTNAPQSVATLPKQPPKDIAAGTDKAILTLADGSRIVLDSAANGQLASQGNSNVVKSGTVLKYSKSNSKDAPTAMTAPPVLNTVSTPRGGQYKLELQDGTKVWLNAATTFRFPAAFTGDERRVEVIGEAYFEVAANRKPFIVTTPASASKPAQQVQVLGTDFNVMAYTDEPQSKTTLIEGKVRVSAVRGGTLPLQGAGGLLSPGEQALLSPSGNLSVDAHADIEQAVAWKNGMQSFKDADIKTIMRQVARWYNIDVEYKGEIPEIGLTGKIPRSISLKHLLEALELNSSLHFELGDGKVTVRP
ncbi:MAG: FecR family protein, partial [Bacteroidetes bacterium]|nr:FecR family protein [Bacteroidota bacterium]